MLFLSKLDRQVRLHKSLIFFAMLEIVSVRNIVDQVVFSSLALRKVCICDIGTFAMGKLLYEGRIGINSHALRFKWLSHRDALIVSLQVITH